MAIFIEWQVEEYEFERWHYTGGGEFDPVMKPVEVTKQALYSNDETDDMIRAAQEYIDAYMTDRPSAKVVIKE